MEQPTQNTFNVDTAASIATLIQLLMDKGVFMEKEFSDMKSRMIAQCDQDMAGRRTEFLKTPEGKFLAAIGAV